MPIKKNNEQLQFKTFIVCLVCFYFCLVTKLLEFICSSVLEMKMYLPVSYKQLFDYLRIYNMHNIVKYTENGNLKS